MKHLLFLVILSVFLNSNSSNACSLAPVDPDDVQVKIQTALQESLGFQLEGANLANSNLHVTLPRLQFLVPLGADCSGLYSANHSSAFRVEYHKNRSICKYSGVAVLIGYGLTNPVKLHGKTYCEPYPFSVGKLVAIAGIGGESTGTGLRTNDGDLVELDLTTNELQDQFEENKRVVVQGYYKTVTGVEIPTREVFTVTQLVDQTE